MEYPITCRPGYCMVHPSRSVPDGLPGSPQALDQRNTDLAELALSRRFCSASGDTSCWESASAQLRHLTTEHWPEPSVPQPPHRGGAGTGSKARSAVAEAGRM